MVHLKLEISLSLWRQSLSAFDFLFSEWFSKEELRMQQRLPRPKASTSEYFSPSPWCSFFFWFFFSAFDKKHDSTSAAKHREKEHWVHTVCVHSINTISVIKTNAWWSSQYLFLLYTNFIFSQFLNVVIRVYFLISRIFINAIYTTF
jgi:hypothetical protein